jgi:Holliday junction resolvase
MSTPESKTKKAVKHMLDEEGVYHFFPPANGYGRSGLPDIICCYRGWFIAIECKAGKGRVTALQERELERIREAGGFALVVYDNEDDLNMLAQTLTDIRNCDERKK